MSEAPTDFPASVKDEIDVRKIKMHKGRTFEAMMNLVIAYMILLFVMLGYIANTMLRAVNEELIFLWRYFNPVTWINDPSTLIPFVAFAAAFFCLGATENVFPYAARKAILLFILLIATALGFHQLLHPGTISIIIFFTSWESYVTIVVLVVAGLIFSWAGNQLKLFNYRRKKREIEYLNRLNSIDRNTKMPT